MLLTARHGPVECLAALDAGASPVVTEGLPSGTGGAFDAVARVRPAIVGAAIVAVGVDRGVVHPPFRPFGGPG